MSRSPIGARRVQLWRFSGVAPSRLSPASWHASTCTVFGRFGAWSWEEGISVMCCGRSEVDSDTTDLPACARVGALVDAFRLDLAWLNIIGGQPVKVSWGWPRILLYAIWYRGFRVVSLYRLAHKAYLGRHRVLERLPERCLYSACGAEIGAGAYILAGFLPPLPQGVFIAAGVEIGSMTVVGQQVTLGGNLGKQDRQGRLFPRIGRGCWIAAGAVVGGPVEIGEGSIVGTNSVVTRSVQAWTVVRGNPAEIVRRRYPKEVPWTDLA